MPATFTHDSPGTGEEEWRRAFDEHLDECGTSYERLLGTIGQLIVVAAHPDDETLGAAGMLSAAWRAAVPTQVVLLTVGEASHPNSPTHSAEQLAARRKSEGEHAVDELAPSAERHWWGFADTRVNAHVDQITAKLVELIGTHGPETLVVAPWREDGHADHEAAGTAAAAACVRTDAHLLEYPIWWWHWATPQQAPWGELIAAQLSPAQLAAKQRAVNCHVSQVRPLSDQPGDEVLLGPELLAHALRDHEWYVRRHPVDHALDRLHEVNDDPWQVESSWYERRKRAVTLAALGREHYRHALDVGCSIGCLAEGLTDRAQQVLAIDSSANAVATARKRAHAQPSLSIEQRSVPHDWPPGTFDLVVISEVGYFMSPAAWLATLSRVSDCLEPGGELVLCHWRHPIDGWLLDARQVHEQAMHDSRFRAVAHYVEPDFVLDVLIRDGQS